MSDYGFAVAYMVRNWASLILFAIAFALLAFGILQVALVMLVVQWPGLHADWLPCLAASDLHSPLFPILGASAWAGVGIAGAYWLTTPLAYARRPGAQLAGTGRLAVVANVLFLPQSI